MKRKIRSGWRGFLGLALVAAVAGVGGVATAGPASAASLQQVTGFGNNPSNLNMYIYVPDGVAANPAILVAIHYCGGSASAFYGGGAGEWVTAANQYKYIIVFPEVTRSSKCFDVYSPAGLKRGGGSDADGIAAMVSYTKQKYNGNANRVFMMGASSGAMMTNVLAATYPDVFKGGVAFSGVPAGCFSTGSADNTWNSQCSGGSITHTAQEWGDIAKAMYPGYTGSYPRMQLWHGATDSTLSYHNYGEEIKQWTNLHGISQTPVLTDSPAANWTRTRYGSNGTQPAVEGISISNLGHDLPQSGMAAYGIKFLGLDGSGGGTTTTTTTSRTTSTTTTTSRSTSTTTTSSSTTTRSTSTTTGSGGGGCSASFSAPNAWTGGFVATLTVTANTAIKGWRVTINLPSGVSVVSGWNATFSGSTGTVTATNASYNGTVAAGQSTQFGFQGSGSPSGVTVSCTAL